MIHRFHQLKHGAAVLVVAAATIAPVTGSAATVVPVATVEQLYNAVNNPANAGASVILAPGIYVLSPTNRPNGGRLDLQQDMSLYGVSGDRAAVVIDATAPGLSFTEGMPPGQRTGVIRTGRGSNTVEWLTIAGNPLAAAAIDTDLFLTLEAHVLDAHVRVAHVVAGNSSRGVDVRNLGAAMSGRRLDAEIVDGEFFGGVEGIRVANFAGADRGEINVVMSGNRSYENALGCIVANNRSSFATVHVRSNGNRFEGNGLGCQIVGGIVGSSGLANSNSTVFEAYGTSFSNNNKRGDFCTPCMGPTVTNFGGLLIVGGDVIAAAFANTTSSNTVTVRLFGSKVDENQTPPGIDFQAFGAHFADLSALAGTDNHVTIELRGSSRQIDVMREDSVPRDPSGSNTVTIFRSPVAP